MNIKKFNETISATFPTPEQPVGQQSHKEAPATFLQGRQNMALPEGDRSRSHEASLLNELRKIREECEKTKWATRAIAIMIAIILIFGLTLKFK